MSGIVTPADPFGSTADPAALVPRSATTRVLEGVQVSLLVGKRSVAVTGPAGIGKTLLLHTLTERLGRAFETVYLPYGALPGRDFCAWVLTLRGESIERDPLRQLPALARSYAGDGKPLLILIDDASSLPEDTVRVLTRLVREADGALRVLLAPTDDFRSGRLLASFGNGLEEHRIEEAMTLDETREYILGRLAWAEAPKETQERFDDAIIEALHEASGGIPGALNGLAAKVLRGDRGILERAAAKEVRSEARPAPVVDFDEVEAELETAPYQPPPPAQQQLEGVAPQEEPDEGEFGSDERQEPPFDGAATIPDYDTDDAAETWNEELDEPWDEYDPGDRSFKAPRINPLYGTIAAAVVVIALFFVAVPALRHRLVGGGAAVVSEEIEGTEGTFGGHVEEVVEEQDRFGDSFATDLREAFDRQDPASEPTQSESVAAATETESAENEEYSGNLIGVNINADPWAHVEVDGVYVGLTPLADVRLTPGLHRIRARLPDGKIVERDVQIDDANRHIAIAP